MIMIFNCMGGEPMKKRLIVISMIILFLAIGYLIVRFSSNKAVEVDSYKVSKESYEEIVSGIGYVEYETEIVIKSEVSGIVESINIGRGERIKALEEIINLDDLQAKQRYQELKANVNLAEGRYEDYINAYNATTDDVKDQLAIKQKELEVLNVNKQHLGDSIIDTEILVKEGIASLSELENLNKEMQVMEKNIEAKKTEINGLNNPTLVDKELKASVEYAKNLLEQQQIEVEKYVVAAPIDGIVTEIYIEAGEYVQVGQDLIKLADDQNKYVKVDIDEKYLSTFSIDQEAYLYIDGQPDKKINGIIKEISPVVDIDTGTIEVKVLILEEQALFLQNMTVRVDVTTFSYDSVTVIPGEYLINKEEGLVVYQSDASDTVIETPVKVLNRNLPKVMVLEGLEVDSIILDPKEIEPGMKVKVK